MGWIILQCFVSSILFWIIYHIWFSSKYNDLDSSVDQESRTEVINEEWVEDENAIDREDLMETANEIIMKQQQENGDGNVSDDESEPEGFEGEDETGFMEDDIVFQEDSHQDENKNDEFGESEEAMEKENASNGNKPTDEETDVLEQIPSIDYLKES